MFRSFLLVLFFSSILLVCAQEKSSISFNGGFIYPKSSTKGLTGLVQFNFPINEQFYLYVYSGYAAWDKYYVVFREDYSIIQKKLLFKTTTIRK